MSRYYVCRRGVARYDVTAGEPDPEENCRPVFGPMEDRIQAHRLAMTLERVERGRAGGRASRYLNAMAREHGGHWPQAALLRLLWLHANQAWTQEDLQDEYEALLAWMLGTLQAGIAFLQR